MNLKRLTRIRVSDYWESSQIFLRSSWAMRKRAVWVTWMACLFSCDSEAFNANLDA